MSLIKCPGFQLKSQLQYPAFCKTTIKQQQQQKKCCVKYVCVCVCVDAQQRVSRNQHSRLPWTLGCFCLTLQKELCKPDTTAWNNFLVQLGAKLCTPKPLYYLQHVTLLWIITATGNWVWGPLSSPHSPFMLCTCWQPVICLCQLDLKGPFYATFTLPVLPVYYFSPISAYSSEMRKLQPLLHVLAPLFQQCVLIQRKYRYTKFRKS